MACITEHYASLIAHVVSVGSAGLEILTKPLGKPFGVAMAMIAMAPTVLLLAYLLQILIPKAFKWYFDKTINEKAEEYWRKRCRGTGVTVAGAKLSIALGVIFFFMARFVVALPMFYAATIPTFVAAFLAVALVGYFWGGNFPSAARAKYKYVKRFYAPTITGIGLGAATIALEFVLEVATLTARYLHSI
jgi:hypothetical protein